MHFYLKNWFEFDVADWYAMLEPGNFSVDLSKLSGKWKLDTIWFTKSNVYLKTNNQ